MRKELFEKVAERMVAFIESQGGEKGPLSIKDTDDFISYTWCTNDRTEKIQNVKDYIKSNGWKASPEMIQASTFGMYRTNVSCNDTYSTFLHMFYTKSTGKISIKETDIGIGYSFNKKKFYPMCRNKPLMCYSSKLYLFAGRKPRHYKSNGKFNNIYIITPAVQIILDLAKEINPFINLSLKAKDMQGAKSLPELFKKATGVAVPKVLCKMNPYSISRLVKIMRNPNELNTLAQYLSEVGETAESWEGGDIEDLLLEYYRHKQPEDTTPIERYLIFDWIHQLHSLRRKTFSLTIQSVKRIKDEHDKLARELRKLNMPEITVHSKYIEFFDKNTSFHKMCAELITNKQRLLEESEMMDHCVSTYGHNINSGECCIISFVYKESRYTLELNHRSDSVRGEYFYIGQLQAYGNCRYEKVPIEFREAVLTAIEKHNEVKTLFPASIMSENEFESLF